MKNRKTGSKSKSILFQGTAFSLKNLAVIEIKLMAIIVMPIKIVVLMNKLSRSIFPPKTEYIYFCLNHGN